MNSRRTAAFIVARWLATGDFPSGMLPPSGADRAFVQDLVYTTIRRRRTLAFALSRLLRTWPRGELEALLLVGAAQILFMDDVPDFAAVNETVDAAKASGGGRRLDRVVNGVLRNLLRRREEIDEAIAAAAPAVRWSFPDGLVARWISRYGMEKAEALAAWHNTPAETWLAFAPRAAEGDEPAREAGTFKRLERSRRVEEVSGFADGAFIVQDPATAGAIDLLDLHPGLSALDFCAAPGGKTAQIAWRLGEGDRLVAQEVNPRRLERLRENMKRLRLDRVECVSAVGDGLFDRVLVDAPCSNTGVLRRRPDARWRWSDANMRQLAELQGRVLEEASAHVAPGGILVYSTCSNEPEENVARTEAFIAAHPDFREVARRESIPFESGHDGAFASALQRA